MAFFKSGSGKEAKVVEVKYPVDIKEWEKEGHKQCDKQGNALKEEKEEAPKG